MIWRITSTIHTVRDSMVSEHDSYGVLYTKFLTFKFEVIRKRYSSLSNVFFKGCKLYYNYNFTTIPIATQLQLVTRIFIISPITENWVFIIKRYGWLLWIADSIFSEICGVSSE